MVEGGARTIGMFLDAGVVDSLRLAVSPAAVGDTRAPRFPEFGRLPFEGRAAKVVRRVGDMEVYEYAFRPAPDGLTLTDRRRLLRAVELGERSEPCGTAYRVGCVVAVRTRAILMRRIVETMPKRRPWRRRRPTVPICSAPVSILRWSPVRYGRRSR